MPSQLKSDTARANGAKSKGPKTAETREKSSRNSLKHGITSRNNMLLACEDPALFQEMVDEYTSFYQPANPIERDLVEEIIGAKWRIRRLKTIEVALVDYEMDFTREEIQKRLTKFDGGIHLGISYKGLTDDSRSVALLSRYESRLQRIYHRSHQAFLDLRVAVAAGLLGQPPAAVSFQPPAPPPPPPPVIETSPTAPVESAPGETTTGGPQTSSKRLSPRPRKKLKHEPSIGIVVRNIWLNDAFRRSKKEFGAGCVSGNRFKNVS